MDPDRLEYFRNLLQERLEEILGEADKTRSDMTGVTAPFPDPTDPGRIRGVRERARQLREQSDFAVIYNARYNLVHQTQYLRGFEDWFCDLVEAPDRFHALMEAVRVLARSEAGRRLADSGLEYYRRHLGPESGLAELELMIGTALAARRRCGCDCARSGQ